MAKLLNISKLQAKWLNSGKALKFGQTNREPDTGNLVSDLMFDFSEEFVADLIAAAKEKKVVAGKGLIQSIAPRIDTEGSGVTRLEIVMSDYWANVEYGRKPGKRPPIKPLIQWIADKGLIKPGPKSAQQAHSLAWVISNKIAKHGTIKRFGYSGSRFIRDTFTRQYMEGLSQVISAVAGEAISVNIVFSADQAKKQYDL